MARIRKDDIVKVISGSKKGTTGKVLSIDTKKKTALVENLGKRTRHVRPSQLNPQGGKREVQVPMDLSKLALVVDEKTGKTSRIGLVKKVEGKGKARVARQLKNKEIK